MAFSSGKPVVMVSVKRFGDAIIRPYDVHAVIAHRYQSQTEEFLVQWRSKGNANLAPYSWHPICELAGADGLGNSSANSCLHHVQLYLDKLEQEKKSSQSERPLKRKSPDFDHIRRLSPFDRSRASSSSAQSDASFDTRDEWNTYNCDLQVKNGIIKMLPTTRLSIDTSSFPTESMKHRSTNSRYNVAASKIRSQFIRSLGSSSGKPVKLINTRDASTPSLSFTFIDDYVYREGVEPPDPAVMEGCGLVRSKYSNQTCRPNMGGNCGCEYTQSCECLEYARVNEKKLDEEQMAQWQNHWQDHEQGVAIDLMGLPKRFPYSKESGLLVMDYLSQRWTIYECNDNCACGPICKSRVVQRGRTVGLEIFRTKNRGWGLRATERLARGQFIDTYRGEVITREEADHRQEASGKGKDSYLFSLDKSLSDGQYLYEIDGEFFGGPSRFINHSCDPNCVVYVVSKDKNNAFLYEIAFFTIRDIEAGEELTFDYKDHDGTEELNEREGTEEGVEEDSIPCLCGAYNCRKWLWK